jgi:hypothetical protein
VPPDAQVRDLLARATRRLKIERALRSIAWGPIAVPLAPGRLRQAPHDAASVIERRDPRFKNVLISADEILRGRLRVPEYVAARVTGDAATLSDGLNLAAILPLRRAAAVAAISSIAWLSLLAAFVWWPSRETAESTAPGRVVGTLAGAWHVSATIVPPAYSGRKPVALRDPDRIEALEGSALHLRIETATPRMRARTPELSKAFSGTDGDAQVVTLLLTKSGYVALEPADGQGDAAGARLIGITVVPDRAPSAQVTAPGKDLLLPDASRRIPIAGSADDDLGLVKLELRYTTISGSGEQFDFREGSSPVAIERESAQRWRASGDLVLPSLGLQPGDTVIYRLVAIDTRGAAGASDTYMIDVAQPGQPTLAGFELPPDRDRHGISQQMVLLKIQRLHARRAAMAAEAFREEALGIAAEQRTVRSTFTFMMGGEVVDEEEEAAHSHEIEEGRLENTARRDMVEAVRHMTVVETRLTAADTGGAIPPARAAVAALERAFGRRRYFLRTLPVRSRIDPSRRLSGELTEARDSTRPIAPADEPAHAKAAREASAELLTLTAQVSASPAMPAREAAQRLGRAAERVLALEPGSADLQGASIRLARRAAAVSAGAAIGSAVDDLRVALDVVTARARRFAPSPLQPDPADGSLKGRWLSAIDGGSGR